MPSIKPPGAGPVAVAAANLDRIIGELHAGIAAFQTAAQAAIAATSHLGARPGHREARFDGAHDQIKALILSDGLTAAVVGLHPHSAVPSLASTFAND